MSLTKVGGDLLKQPLTIGTGVTISSDGINASGIITATSFVGDISQATGAAAGLGTALSQDQSNPLNKIYYTDTVLSIGSTQTVNPPDSSNIAYTQYAEIAVDEGFDLIVEDGDDLIPDILGLSTETAGLLSGAGGRIRADQFTNKAGTGAPSFPNGVNVTGVVTATSFSGNITGDVTGNLTGNVTGDLTGNVTSSGISSFSGELNVGAGKSIRLYGATSGYSEIVAAAGSASTTFTLPANGGSASQYLQTDGSGGLSWVTPAAGLFESIAVISDTKAQNTSGGTSTGSGTYDTRDLNTEDFDPDGIVSISSNQFTLGAGTYVIDYWTTAYATEHVKARLRDITNGVVRSYSDNGYGRTTNAHHQIIRGIARVTITGNTVYEIQMAADLSQGGGLGTATNIDDEVYTRVIIYKEA